MLQSSVILIVLLFLKNGFSFTFDTDSPLVYVNQNPGQRSNYFGYSVALHQSWVEIGAPRGNDSQISSKEPGSIFRCKIHGPCISRTVDKMTGYGKIGSNRYDDKKDGAWIGGTMDIDMFHERVVSCGFRWINNRPADYWMQGVCYWSHFNDSDSQKLLPLVDETKAFVTSGSYVSYYYAQGQVGFSTHFTKSVNNSELLLGAPGVFNWDGTLLIYRDGDVIKPIASKSTARDKRGASPEELINLNIADTINSKQTRAFSLLGYAVTSGYFFGRQLYYAASAPRSDSLSGQVLIFQFGRNTNMPLEVKHICKGQFGEYFGAALLGGDINNDGFDDLIIGAPYYSNKEQNEYNRGRIYVYLGSALGKLVEPKHGVIISGSENRGEFGKSMTLLGDIDVDGFADVAVSAPYARENSGAVYIFRGTADGLDPNPAQIIFGKDINQDVRGFGISLSKVADVDGNRFLDVAVGAYLSEQVVILRAKPPIVLEHTMKPITLQLDTEKENFTVEVCFCYKGSFLPPTINISRTITVDEILQRAHLSLDTPKTTIMEIREMSMKCDNITIFLKKDANQFTTPIKITVSQSLITDEVGKNVIFIGSNSNVTDNFCRSCPVLNEFRSQLTKYVDLPFVLGCGADNICEAELKLDLSFPNRSDEFLIGTEYLELAANVTNTGENAFLTQVLVELPPLVEFQSVPSTCSEQNSSSIILCDLEYRLEGNQSKMLLLTVDMKQVDTKYGSVLKFIATVLTTSVNNHANRTSALLHLIHEADLGITGNSDQQSYSYENVTTGKPPFRQIYQIEKFGMSPIDEVDLEIRIPTTLRHSSGDIKFVGVYTPQGVFSGQPLNCRSDIEYLYENEFGIDAVSDGLNVENKDVVKAPVKKRSVENGLKKFADHFSTKQNEFELLQNRTFYINCSDENVVCESIYCKIGPFKTKQNIAVLQIKMVMNVGALKDVKKNKDIVILTTEGEITIISPKNFVQTGKRPDLAMVSSIFVGTSSEEVATWIIIVAAIAGILLLILLILCLVKVGFFQRKKKKELQLLKEAEDSSSPNKPTDVCILDWQLSRFGSPALDLSYFLLTCTDKSLRDAHWDELLREYHNSLANFLAELGSDVDLLFPYEIFLQHVKEFFRFGLSMAVIVVFMMVTEVEEVPDWANANAEETSDLMNYETKNKDLYTRRVRDIILDCVEKGYL